MEFWIVIAAMGTLLAFVVHELLINEEKINNKAAQKSDD